MNTAQQRSTRYLLAGGAQSVATKQIGSRGVTEVTTSQRVRWRMTLDELCYRSQTRPPELEHWRVIGVFGARWQEPRDRGCWRHISKLVAQRAIIMRTLLDAGLTEKAALQIVSQHVDVKDTTTPINVTGKGLRMVIYKQDLNLP